MINSIIEGISISLNAEFGDNYTTYTESVEQGLKEPCFFVFCINPTNRVFLGKRYFKTNQMCILSERVAEAEAAETKLIYAPGNFLF